MAVISQQLIEDMSWREQGKCWGRNTRGLTGAFDPWFPTEPVGGQPAATPLIKKREAAAADLCRGCPVIARCLEYAVEHRDVRGVWGGTLTHQRKLLRRKENRAARERRNKAERARAHEESTGSDKAGNGSEHEDLPAQDGQGIKHHAA
jgi:hypothetical protein